MSRLQDLFVSLESEDDVIAEDGDIEESTAYAILEVEEAAEEVEAAEEDIEELEEIEEGLESIASAIEVAAENGGLDRKAAMFAHMAVGAYTSRYGVSSEAVMVGLESFGGDTASEEATKVSLEGIGEQIKKIWVAIKSAVQKAIKAVSDFFAKLFGGVDKVLAKAEALQKSVKELSSNKKVITDAKAKVTVPNTETLKFGNKVDSKSILSGVGKTAELVDYAFKDITQAAKATIASHLTLLDKVAAAKDEAAVDEALEAATKAGAESISLVEKAEKMMVSGDKVLVRHETTEAGTSNTKGSLGGTAVYSLGNSSNSKNFSGDASIAPLDIAEMTSLVGDVIKILKKIKGEDKTVEAIAKSRKTAVEKGDKAAAASDKNAVAKIWEKTKARMALRSVQADVLRPITQITAHGFSVSRSALVLVERSTKLYGDKK